jgi:hypothetical protein
MSLTFFLWKKCICFTILFISKGSLLCKLENFSKKLWKFSIVSRNAAALFHIKNVKHRKKAESSKLLKKSSIHHHRCVTLSPVQVRHLWQLRTRFRLLFENLTRKLKLTKFWKSTKQHHTGPTRAQYLRRFYTVETEKQMFELTRVRVAINPFS